MSFYWALVDRWILNYVKETWYPGLSIYIRGDNQEKYPMVLDLCAHREGNFAPRRLQLFRVMSLPDQIVDGINYPGRAEFNDGN